MNMLKIKILKIIENMWKSGPGFQNICEFQGADLALRSKTNDSSFNSDIHILNIKKNSTKQSESVLKKYE